MALLVLAPGALVSLGCFLPMVSASVSFVGISGSGNLQATDTTLGKVALVLGFAALLMGALDVRSGDRRLKQPTAAAAILGALLVGYKGWALESQLNGLGGSIVTHASLGVGVWVALLGGVAAVVSTFVTADA